MKLKEGHIYIPKRALEENDINLGIKMLLDDSKRLDATHDKAFIRLKGHKSKGNFIVYSFLAKGDWQEWLHNLNDFVSNPMIFASMLLKIRQLGLAFYYDIADSGKQTNNGVFLVAGDSYLNFHLSTAAATAVNLGQI